LTAFGRVASIPTDSRCQTASRCSSKDAPSTPGGLGRAQADQGVDDGASAERRAGEHPDRAFLGVEEAAVQVQLVGSTSLELVEVRLVPVGARLEQHDVEAARLELRGDHRAAGAGADDAHVRRDPAARRLHADRLRHVGRRRRQRVADRRGLLRPRVEPGEDRRAQLAERLPEASVGRLAEELQALVGARVGEASGGEGLEPGRVEERLVVAAEPGAREERVSQRVERAARRGHRACIPACPIIGLANGTGPRRSA
jgi:hypothetical protein